MKIFAKNILLILIIIAVSSLCAVFSDRYIFPRLAGSELFARNKWLRNLSADTTVINRTEQIFVKEDSSVAKLASNIFSSVANIAVYSADGRTNRPSLAGAQNTTGVIITSDGLIMAYFPVAPPEGARYTVILSDQSTYEGRLTAVDFWSNLVFLKINASNLPAISFGDSEEFKAGEKIIAVGNNLGNYQNRLAQGIIKSYNREFNLSSSTLSSSEKMEGVFEMDKNINDDFVGGPVIDYSGETIAIAGSVARNNETRYFLIPANKVKLAIARLIRQESDQSPSLGIYYVPLTKSLAASGQFPSEKGAMIYSSSGQQGLAVLANSPAAKAGLEIYDVITSFGGQEINGQNTLPDLLYKYKKGDLVEMTVLRSGREIKINVQL